MGVLGFLLAGHATPSFPIKVEDALSRKVAFCVEQRMTEPVLEHVKVCNGSHRDECSAAYNDRFAPLPAVRIPGATETFGAAPY